MAGGRSTGPLDTCHGWEGGFFRDLFFSLGREDHTTRMPQGRPILKGRNVHSEEHERFLHALKTSDSYATYQHGEFYRHEPKVQPSRDALALRAVIARAYLLDLAVLAQADAVVCAVSSAACRVLGVMIGWDAVSQGNWRNVDGSFGWQGLAVGKP
jgi:hypothetical protein